MASRRDNKRHIEAPTGSELSCRSWTTRHYGNPKAGVHAIQMELAMRGYLSEPTDVSSENWPPPMDDKPAILPVLRRIIAAALDFAKGNP